MKRALFKRIDERAAWDLDPGCRRIVDQSTPARRRLLKRLKHQARARIKKEDEKCRKE